MRLQLLQLFDVYRNWKKRLWCRRALDIKLIWWKFVVKITNLRLLCRKLSMTSNAHMSRLIVNWTERLHAWSLVISNRPTSAANDLSVVLPVTPYNSFLYVVMIILYLCIWLWRINWFDLIWFEGTIPLGLFWKLVCGLSVWPLPLCSSTNRHEQLLLD